MSEIYWHFQWNRRFFAISLYFMELQNAEIVLPMSETKCSYFFQSYKASSEVTSQRSDHGFQQQQANRGRLRRPTQLFDLLSPWKSWLRSPSASGSWGRYFRKIPYRTLRGHETEHFFRIEQFSRPWANDIHVQRVTKAGFRSYSRCPCKKSGQAFDLTKNFTCIVHYSSDI